MATIEEMLNKKGPQRKPFKKVSYKPWESSFLNEEDVSIPEDMTSRTGEISKKEEEGGKTNESPSEIQVINADKISSAIVHEQEKENVEKESDNITAKVSDIVCEMKSEVDDSLVENHSNFNNDKIEDFNDTNTNVSLRTTVFVERSDSPLSATKAVDTKALIKAPLVPEKRVIFRLQSIIGVCRLILFDLVKREEYRDENFIYCSSVTTSELSLMHNTTYRGMATTLNRLKSRGYLFAVDGKRGKGGYSVYSVPLFIVREIEKWNEQQTF